MVDLFTATKVREANVVAVRRSRPRFRTKSMAETPGLGKRRDAWIVRRARTDAGRPHPVGGVVPDGGVGAPRGGGVSVGRRTDRHFQTATPDWFILEFHM
jgi:hypothetical protein